MIGFPVADSRGGTHRLGHGRSDHRLPRREGPALEPVGSLTAGSVLANIDNNATFYTGHFRHGEVTQPWALECW